MRVALVHNRYLERGGEDTVVEHTGELLAKAGHQVHHLVVDNREEIGTSRLGAVRTGLRARWNPASARRVEALLDAHPVDVAHVHNFFPVLSPSVYGAFRARGVPVVQTLHNYRLLCANGLFFRAGRPCEECVARGPWNAVRHGCYRGSRLQTAVWSEQAAHHARRRTWRRDVDLFTTPSEYARARLWAADLPAARVRVLPNPVPDPGEPRPGGEGAVFVGRLSPEKGVAHLLEAWRELGDTPLTIVGTGPEEAALRERARSLPAVRFTGALSREGVDAELRRASFAVVPSLWYETFGMAAAEAMALGTPVVAPRRTAVEELLESGRAGLLFDRGDLRGLAQACSALAFDPERARFLGEEARALYEETLVADLALDRLLCVYEEAIDRLRGS